MPTEPDAIARPLRDAGRARKETGRAQRAAAHGHTGTEGLHDRRDELDPPAVEDPATGSPRRVRSRTYEAHFAVASLAVDGDPMPVRYAGLDVYHHGPDYGDAAAATWEVQCTFGSEVPRLEVRHEYSVLITTRDGRRFSGRAFMQHASREVCTLLDVGEPLDGLEPADYLP